jgi:hypothetical protein
MKKLTRIATIVKQRMSVVTAAALKRHRALTHLLVNDGSTRCGVTAAPSSSSCPCSSVPVSLPASSWSARLVPEDLKERVSKLSTRLRTTDMCGEEETGQRAEWLVQICAPARDVDNTNFLIKLKLVTRVPGAVPGALLYGYQRTVPGYGYTGTRVLGRLPGPVVLVYPAPVMLVLTCY